jgi:hypothetical protein
MPANRSNIVAENAFLIPVIPSEEDRSLVNDLHSREPALSDRPAGGSRMGTCFSRSLHDATLRERAGLSTPLEMTECGSFHDATRVLPCPRGATQNV